MMQLDDTAKAKDLLAQAGFDFPFLPDHLGQHFKERSAWVYSTKALRLSPYCFREYVAEGKNKRVQDYMLLGHAGHGANSYALHYYLVTKPLRLFLQVAWGGIYMDTDPTVRRVNQCFGIIPRLVSAIDHATVTNRLRRNDTLIVACSEFYGSYWIRPDSAKREPTERIPSSETPAFILTEVLEWVNGLAS